MDLERAQRGGGVRREERVARARGEDDDAALLQVAHRTAADVGLGDLGYLDRRHHPRVGALPLERVLKRQRVQDRGEHPHVVGGRAVHSRGGAGQAAVDVAGADDDGHLHPALGEVRDLASDPLDALGVGSVLQGTHQRLAGELEKDSLEDGVGHAGRQGIGGSSGQTQR